jgi:hypothetical protein
MSNATLTRPPRQRKPRPKPQRFVRLCIRPEGAAPGVIRLTVNGKAQDYFLIAIPADFGRGFLVEKVGIDATEGKYAVNIDGERKTCECKGYLKWGHCKHSAGVAALIARNLL